MDVFKIAQVLKPQGIKGEIKLKPFVDDIERFRKLPHIYLKRGGDYEKRQVLSGRTYKQFAYVLIEGCEDRNTAETLRGQFLYLDREHAAPLPEGAHYIADLLGLRVETESGQVLGQLEEIFNTGSVDIYSVTGGEKNFLFPNAPGVILSRSPEEGRIVVAEERLREVRLDG